MIRRLIILLLIVGCVTEPEDCAGVAGGTAIEDCLGVCGGDATLTECEALGDMAVLQDIINLNNLHPSDAPFYEPTEIGEQTWADGRLTSLDLSNWSLDTLPSSISNFTALTYLDLRQNYIATLPNEICVIYESLSTLYLNNNYICPPYPDCITTYNLYYVK